MDNEVQFENTLERLLAEAVTSEAARPHFLRELLHNSVLICPHGAIEESDDPAKQTATLKLAAIDHNGTPYVPFYLAPKFLPRDVRYISLPARTFFEITRGSHLVLNPGAKSGKLFSPDEVANLLSGRLLEAEKEFQIRNDAKVLVGAAKEVPPRLLEQLTMFFDAEPLALRAWLGWYHNLEAEKDPGYLLAIETTRDCDFRALAGRTTLVLKEVGTLGRYCDIAQFQPRGLTQYFSTERPFYSKGAWTRFVRSLRR